MFYVERTWNSSFIQLARQPLKLEIPLIDASLFVWSTTTNNFHFSYGMMHSTLFDFTAITGLWPDGDLVNPCAATNTPFLSHSYTAGFSKFLKTVHKSEPEVSEVKHIAFLLQ